MLNQSQILEFYTQGCLRLPGFIKEPETILEFLRQNQFLEPDETWFNKWEGIHPGFLPFEKHLAPIAEQILGAQSSLSFIQISNVKSPSFRWKKFHIDGQDHVTKRGLTFDGVPWFKIIFGVFLTKIDKDCGELIVSPKGHWEVENFFKKNAKRFWKDGVFVANAKEAYHELIDTIPLTMSPVYANPGDVVLFHSMMPHRVGANNSTDRPVIYFRYGQYESQGEKALTSMWQGFDGLKHLLTNPELVGLQTPPSLPMSSQNI